MKKKFLAAVMALVMIGTTPVGVFADTMVKSYLTGLDVPESEGRVRPVAVMLNNIKQGLQYHLPDGTGYSCDWLLKVSVLPHPRPVPSFLFTAGFPVASALTSA